MNGATYTYRTSEYFSAAGRALGWVATVIGLMSVVNGAMFGWALVPVTIVTQYTYNMVEFDLQGKTYRDGVVLLGMKFGKKLPLPGFEFLFLKRNSYSNLLESRGAMTQFRAEKFDGYVKLANGVKLHLLQKDGKAQAVQQLQTIAQDLHTELRDLTEITY